MSTPTKTDSHQFKPIDMATRSKDHPGIIKTVYTHVIKLHVLLSDWNRMKDKGIRVFRGVSSLKLHECLDDYYPSQLKPLMQNLVEIVDKLKNIVSAMRIVDVQLQALARLQPSDEPVITTWSATQISKSVSEILKSAEKEFKLKEAVVENVAHCRDEQLIEVYVSAWEYEVYLNADSFAYLFAELGLIGVP